MKKRKHINTSGVRILTVIISLALCLGFTVSIKANDGGQAVGAVGYAMERAGERNVSVYVNGQRYGGRAFLSGSVTYVGIREFSMHMGVSSVSWNSERKTATVKSDSLSLSARNANLYITANGRYLWAGSGVIIRNGTMYVPLRTLAKAFGCSVSWNAADFSASVTGGGAIVSGDGFYNSESLYWLSRIIHAEASGESLLGKVAVGTVVLNRVASPEFPNSIHGVIFDKKNGVQFTPVANGAINCTPSEESVIAAKLCLDGASISDKALFFINEALAQSSWVSDNRPFLIAVGNHKFYA
ncbi:MAG: copper amine oxidase [Ruminococcaceae bacterium]|nr:copper amine oxidase [Oscillospiraceae bacterium]